MVFTQLVILYKCHVTVDKINESYGILQDKTIIPYNIIHAILVDYNNKVGHYMTS